MSWDRCDRLAGIARRIPKQIRAEESAGVDQGTSVSRLLKLEQGRARFAFRVGALSENNRQGAASIGSRAKGEAVAGEGT